MSDFRCAVCGGTGLASHATDDVKLARGFDEGVRAVAEYVTDNADTLQRFAAEGRAVEFVGMFLKQFTAPNPYLGSEGEK